MSSVWDNYECDAQMSMFDIISKPMEINKKIRLIELFAGYGSQAMALRNIGANFEHYKVVEFDKYAIKSYNAVHGTNFPDIDIKNVKGSDLEIVDCDKFTYLLTYLLISMHRFVGCWQDGWYVKRKWNKKWFALGSRKDIARDC